MLYKTDSFGEDHSIYKDGDIIKSVKEWVKQFTLTIRNESEKEIITEFINEELLEFLQTVEVKPTK